MIPERCLKCLCHRNLCKSLLLIFVLWVCGYLWQWQELQHLLGFYRLWRLLFPWKDPCCGSDSEAHKQTCQPVPEDIVLHLALQNSAVLPFTEHAMYFSNTEISVLCLFSPMSWLFSQQGGLLFLEPLLLGLTFFFQYQSRTSQELETSCSFMASVSCLCLWTALARAAAAASSSFAWLQPCCLQLILHTGPSLHSPVLLECEVCLHQLRNSLEG